MKIDGTGEQKYLGTLDLESEETKQRIGKGKDLTHISLFTGCGGMDVGMSKAGFRSIAMIEFNHDCCETLRANWHWQELKKRTIGGHYVNLDGSEIGEEGAIVGKSKWVEGDKPQWETKEEMMKDIDWYHDPEPIIFERDICTVSTEEIMEKTGIRVGECSLISGGFPCQGFSMAGKRIREDPRNRLYNEFVRIVDDLKPATIIGENVQGLVSMGKGEVIQQICEDFANAGYDISWNILNCADFGVPQTRIRLILVGKRVDMFRIKEDGSPALHIASCPGSITHPKFFKERLNKWSKDKNPKVREQVLSLIKKIQEDPRIEFVGDKND